MRKKILLVNGPSQDPSDRFFGWPTPLLYAIAPSVAEARQGKINLEFVSGIFDPTWYVEGKNDSLINEQFKHILQKERVDIICTSTIYDSLYPTLCLFETARKVNPDITTILGGPHFDEIHSISRFNDVSLRSDLIDIAIAGDAEYSLKSALESLSQDKSFSSVDWNSIPGRSWIYTNRGERYASSGNPIDINNLPFMPLELADTQRHKNDFDIFSDQKGTILPTAQMIAARGCPYTCNFCSENRNLAYPNARSIYNIIEEIEVRKEQGFKVIFFDDSTFGAYPKLRDLLHALKNMRMKFGSLNRFNHLTNPNLVNSYREAGFEYVYCSIEQFDNKTLKEMNKSQKAETIESSIKLLNNYGFSLGVSLLYGLPYETEKSIQKTLDFTAKWVDKGTIKLVSESILSYHPGTLAGKMLQEGFQRTPPNQGYPFNRFEEGQWYHPPHVTSQYLEKILFLSEQRFGKAMVRNRHSWYAQKGITLI